MAGTPDRTTTYLVNVVVPPHLGSSSYRFVCILLVIVIISVFTFYIPIYYSRYMVSRIYTLYNNNNKGKKEVEEETTKVDELMAVLQMDL